MKIRQTSRAFHAASELYWVLASVVAPTQQYIFWKIASSKTDFYTAYVVCVYVYVYALFPIPSWSIESCNTSPQAHKNN